MSMIEADRLAREGHELGHRLRQHMAHLPNEQQRDTMRAFTDAQTPEAVRRACETAGFPTDFITNLINFFVAHPALFKLMISLLLGLL